MRRSGVLLLALGACSSSTATPDLGLLDRAGGEAIARDLAAEARADARRDGPRPPAHWKTISGASLPLEGISVTPLANGELLIAGGYAWESNKKVHSRKAYRYLPTSDALVPAGELASPRAYHAATLLPDGTVLVSGGQTSETSSYVVETEIFDPTKPAGAEWRAGPPLPQARRGGHALAVPDGVMVSGGTTNGTYVLDTVVFFKPGESGWSVGLTPLKEARRDHSAVLLADGKVLIAGGARGSYNAPEYLFSLEVYDRKSGTSTLLASPMSKQRGAPSLTLLDDGRVLIVGGYCGANCTGKLLDDLYDPKTDTVTPVAHPGAYPSQSHVAVKLLDGRVLITANAMAAADHLVVAFTPTGWETLPQMPHPRYLARAARLPDGSVLVAGGVKSTNPITYAAELERFFP